MALSKFATSMNKATSIAQNVRSTLNKANGIFSSETTNSSIRDRYTNGFYGDTTQFRPNIFSRLFDEPTYLTFRLEFDFKNNKERIENLNTISGTKGSWASLDYMPEPFLSLMKYDNNTYSTYRYLKDALGENKRAEMLERFIDALKDIQENYPYYFKGIEGLGNLSTVSPNNGMRINDDNNTLTIECLEGIDLKITQLMQLYRKIVWDDVYQRWVLPDMMRYFTLRIYVSEIRLFHTMSRNSSAKEVGRIFDLNNTDTLNATSYDKLPTGRKGLLGMANNIVNTALGMSSSIFGVGSGATKVLSDINMGLDSASSLLNSLKGNMKLCDNAINDVMPTIVYECRMCEFDISDTLSHINKLTSSKEGLEMVSPIIKIKVGKLKEIMYFPLENGLQISNDGRSYQIYKPDNNVVAKILYDDNVLKETATSREKDYTSSNNTEFHHTTKAYRMNRAFGPATDKDEAYDPFTADRKTSLTSLVGGIAGYFGTKYESEAIDGEHTQEIKSLYSIDSSIHNSEAIDLGSRHSHEDPEDLHSSEAVTKGEQLPNKTPEDLHSSEAVRNSQQSTQNETPEDLHSSEAVTKGEQLPNTMPDKLHKSTATNIDAKIQTVINEDGAEKVLSAATSIKETIKYIEDNDIIKSVATNDEHSKELLKTIVLDNALSSLSAATDPDAKTVKKLADIIKEELHKSTAVNEGNNRKKKDNMHSFKYLNKS